MEQSVWNFWEDWRAADLLKRIELCKQLLGEPKDKIFYAFSPGLLNSYLEDLEEYMEAMK